MTGLGPGDSTWGLRFSLWLQPVPGNSCRAHGNGPLSAAPEPASTRRLPESSSGRGPVARGTNHVIGRVEGPSAPPPPGGWRLAGKGAGDGAQSAVAHDLIRPTCAVKPQKNPKRMAIRALGQWTCRGVGRAGLGGGAQKPRVPSPDLARGSPSH